jgi:hypothetical protein
MGFHSYQYAIRYVDNAEDINSFLSTMLSQQMNSIREQNYQNVFRMLHQFSLINKKNCTNANNAVLPTEQGMVKRYVASNLNTIILRVETESHSP